VKAFAEKHSVQLIYSLQLLWGILCYLETPLVLKEAELEKKKKVFTIYKTRQSSCRFL